MVLLDVFHQREILKLRISDEEWRKKIRKGLAYELGEQIASEVELEWSEFP